MCVPIKEDAIHSPQISGNDNEDEVMDFKSKACGEDE